MEHTMNQYVCTTELDDHRSWLRRMATSVLLVSRLFGYLTDLEVSACVVGAMHTNKTAVRDYLSPDTKSMLPFSITNVLL